MEEQAITYKQFLDTMHGIRELANYVYPDRYKMVCMQHGIKESTAMNMYSHFQTICGGRFPFESHEQLSDEQIANIIHMAVEAKTLYMEHCRGVDGYSFGKKHWYRDLNMILVVWSQKDSDELQYTKLSLSTQEAYVTIGRMADNGVKIHNIIRQSDLITDTNTCMSLTDEERRAHKPFVVFDGDVILAYVNEPGFWRDDARNSGLYLCHNGAYRRLLYTPGKGYMRRGEPDTDDEFYLSIDEENCFNSHVLTSGQKWKVIGNVHVDTGFLVEQETKKE